jgi:hypothetical protein
MMNSEGHQKVTDEPPQTRMHICTSGSRRSGRSSRIPRAPSASMLYVSAPLR